jgi:hypothetical protein
MASVLSVRHRWMGSGFEKRDVLDLYCRKKLGRPRNKKFGLIAFCADSMRLFAGSCNWRKDKNFHTPVNRPKQFLLKKR